MTAQELAAKMTSANGAAYAGCYRSAETALSAAERSVKATWVVKMGGRFYTVSPAQASVLEPAGLAEIY